MRVRSIIAFLARNRLAIVLLAVALAGGSLAFELLLGLTSVVWIALVALVVVLAMLMHRRSGRPVVSALLAAAVVSLAIQLIPYGRDHSNPPVVVEPAWDSAQTRQLVVRACFDCHSNEVEYPWYSAIAPMSWAVQLHVDRGRSELNYSEWDRQQREAHESAETVREGEMPPGYYTRLANQQARLTDAEVRDLVAGLEATFGSEGGRAGEGRDD